MPKRVVCNTTHHKINLCLELVQRRSDGLAVIHVEIMA